jgi:ubiquinone/menaquinone biosynthesis C-methylase UbiE
MARWYARQRATESRLAAVRKQATELTHDLSSGARVLEIAAGPGYLAIESAWLGRFDVTGLDISPTFVAIACENARQAGVNVEFRHGDAAAAPFEAHAFDLVLCQAAFKNFVEPVGALNEMHRVLRPGGTAIIQDLSRDASNADIDREVKAMKLSRFNTLTTKFVLGTMLRRRAYTLA